MVVYRATPADVASGVRVGGVEYPGFPAAGAGMQDPDGALRVAFFALLYDQDLAEPIAIFARDEAGNESTAPFIDQTFAKPIRRSRIELDDRFLERAIPEIVQRSPEIQDAAKPGDRVAEFLAVNGALRRANAQKIATISAATAASKLWDGPFAQLGNSQVEAGFADHRTYYYGGREIDQQVHLGFDLAVTQAVPIAAANAGKVLYADWLGIYGNCVIIDHGLGVSSLYAHLSSMEVSVGQTVTKGQTIGRSGMTGLAGGDHLHFTMLLGGNPVNPVEWWDPQWVRDRIDRKLAATASSVEPR
jgi:murein DD-endopeptidase MepM/ murein hydrolase activator NlpD